MKKILLLPLLFLALSLSGQDTSYVRQTINVLTSPQLYGRGYSYRGDSIAAQFIRSELRRLRVRPLNDNFFQEYSFSVFSMEGPLSLEVDGKKMKAYTDYRVTPWSKSTWGEYRVVTVPAATLVDSDLMGIFLKKNKKTLSDVFVYVDVTDFSGDDGAKSRLSERVADMQRRNPFNSKGIIVGVDRLGAYSMSNTGYEHGYAYIEVLASAMPKKVKRLDCSIFTQFVSDYKTRNIYGYVKGEVDTMIVYSAHYDHLGTMGDSVVFYGAHDNASGVAALLDIARMAVSDQPHYTHLFCFFSGEEVGLCGSKYAAEHPLFDFDKVRLMINLDMFCGGNEGLMVFNANDERTRPFVERLERLNAALQVSPEIRRRENRPNSDHWYFSQHVPVLYFLTMGGPYGGYHDPMDVCSGCGLEYYINYITLITSLAL